jgi:GNAT superfamily N-acetyltransferase
MAPVRERGTVVTSLEIRRLARTELSRVDEIDRTERIDLMYEQQGTALVARRGTWSASAWDRDGRGEHSVQAQRHALEHYCDAGGIALGAFSGGRLVGIGAVVPDVRPSIAQLAYLHVSEPFRAARVGSRLCEELELIAGGTGATEVVVSATPSENTVRFYLGRGYQPMADPLPELLELEPEDVHMKKQISRMTTTAEPSPRTIDFAGRRWKVKRASEPVGPGPNRFDDSAAAVDVGADGRLVLRVHRSDDRWRCAEVIGEEVTGYGTYAWTIHTRLAEMDRHVVLGMFTWSDDPDQPDRELDIEVSAWGRDGAVVGQFVVQPFARPGHLQTFTVRPTASWQCSFDWSPGRVTFRASDAQPWTFAGDAVPTPVGVRPRTNLWLFRGAKPNVGAPVAVTIASFQFTPAGTGATARS